MAQDAAAALIADRAEHGEWVPTERPGAVVASVDVRMPANAAAVA